MNMFFKNDGIFITHLESLALKHRERQGFVKTWQYAKFLLHLSMYLGVLTTLKVLNASMQQEKHEPVYMLHNFQIFN